MDNKWIGARMPNYEKRPGKPVAYERYGVHGRKIVVPTGVNVDRLHGSAIT